MNDFELAWVAGLLEGDRSLLHQSVGDKEMTWFAWLLISYGIVALLLAHREIQKTWSARKELVAIQPPWMFYFFAIFQGLLWPVYLLFYGLSDLWERVK